jgi:Ceramidase
VLSKGAGVWVLIVVTVVVASGALTAPRFAQPLSYHHFADQRSWLGIANFANVASNAAFAIVGVWGLLLLLSSSEPALFIDARERWAYVTVFAGMVLVAAGSSYYHLAPDNAGLVWDRLPMAIVFMALVDAMITERVSVRGGLVLLPVLLAVGMGSVLQWHLSEVRGAGDLRFYAAVQVYAVMALLVMLMLPSRYTRGGDLAIVVVFYVLAKLLEIADAAVFSLGHVVSGHTLKHLAAAAAGWLVLRMLETRRPVPLCTEEQQSTRLNTVEVLSGSVDGLPTDLNARKKGYLRSSGYGKKRSF